MEGSWGGARWMPAVHRPPRIYLYITQTVLDWRVSGGFSLGVAGWCGAALRAPRWLTFAAIRSTWCMSPSPLSAKTVTFFIYIDKTPWFGHNFTPGRLWSPGGPGLPPGASLVSPDASQMVPRCLQDASQSLQIPPRCFPDVSRCLPDASRCLPDASRCFPDASQMPPT